MFAAQIQQRTEEFKYGTFDSRDRPPPILVKHLASDRLCGTAAQKLLLFHRFPIIFYDIVEQLSLFSLYRLLREIIDHVLSFPIRKSWLPHLNELCVEFQSSMAELLPNKMTPKIHFISEYAKVIEDYGPPTKYWCMRYEGKHAYFKQIAIRSNNYKNLSKTLSIRHQFRQCLFLSKQQLFTNIDQAINMKNVDACQLIHNIKTLLKNRFGPLDMHKSIVQCSTLWHQRIEYIQGTVIVTCLDHVEEQPYFLFIDHIICIQKKWWIIGESLITKRYCDILCAWEVESTGEYKLIDPNMQKFFHKGLDVYAVNGETFVSLASRLTQWQ
jgi:hypothetical protein